MKNKAAQQLGSLGGQKTAKRGKDYYREIGKKGAAKRWGKKREHETEGDSHTNPQ